MLNKRTANYMLNKHTANYMLNKHTAKYISIDIARGHNSLKDCLIEQTIFPLNFFL